MTSPVRPTRKKGRGYVFTVERIKDFCWVRTNTPWNGVDVCYLNLRRAGLPAMEQGTTRRVRIIIEKE